MKKRNAYDLTVIFLTLLFWLFKKKLSHLHLQFWVLGLPLVKNIESDCEFQPCKLKREKKLELCVHCTIEFAHTLLKSWFHASWAANVFVVTVQNKYYKYKRINYVV